MNDNIPTSSSQHSQSMKSCDAWERLRCRVRLKKGTPISKVASAMSLDLNGSWRCIRGGRIWKVGVPISFFASICGSICKGNASHVVIYSYSRIPRSASGYAKKEASSADEIELVCEAWLQVYRGCLEALAYHSEVDFPAFFVVGWSLVTVLSRTLPERRLRISYATTLPLHLPLHSLACLPCLPAWNTLIIQTCRRALTSHPSPHYHHYIPSSLLQLPLPHHLVRTSPLNPPLTPPGPPTPQNVLPCDAPS